MNNKVYIVQYTYTETFCSPHPDVWERQTHVVIATLDEQKAISVMNEHNSNAEYQAELVTHDLT